MHHLNMFTEILFYPDIGRTLGKLCAAGKAQEEVMNQ